MINYTMHAHVKIIDRHVLLSERVNTKILQTSEDTPRAAPIIQPNKNQHPRHLQRQHQERDNSGHEIHGMLAPIIHIAIIIL